ncbi:MAG: hypothetical protein HUU57_07645 [Bdellovibrio sp.]|nr:hypothetical protein [Bdellovibrio sp.]
MKHLRLFLIIQFISLVAFAQQLPTAPSVQKKTSYVQILLLNPEMRFEYDSNKELIDRKPLNLAAVYGRAGYSIALEYARFTESSGNTSSRLQRTHQDVVVWARYHVLPDYALSENNFVTLYAGAGVGALEESVETTLAGVSRTDKGTAKLLSGLSAGGQVKYHLQNFGTVLGLEARGLFASDFSPNPMGSIVLHLGVFVPF